MWLIGYAVFKFCHYILLEMKCQKMGLLVGMICDLSISWSINKKVVSFMRKNKPNRLMPILAHHLTLNLLLLNYYQMFITIVYIILCYSWKKCDPTNYTKSVAVKCRSRNGFCNLQHASACESRTRAKHHKSFYKEPTALKFYTVTLLGTE